MIAQAVREVGVGVQARARRDSAGRRRAARPRARAASSCRAPASVSAPRMSLRLARRSTPVMSTWRTRDEARVAQPQEHRAEDDEREERGGGDSRLAAGQDHAPELRRAVPRSLRVAASPGAEAGDRSRCARSACRSTCRRSCSSSATAGSSPSSRSPPATSAPRRRSRGSSSRCAASASSSSTSPRGWALTRFGERATIGAASITVILTLVGWTLTTFGGRLRGARVRPGLRLVGVAARAARRTSARSCRPRCAGGAMSLLGGTNRVGMFLGPFVARACHALRRVRRRLRRRDRPDRRRRARAVRDGVRRPRRREPRDRRPRRRDPPRPPPRLPDRRRSPRRRCRRCARRATCSSPLWADSIGLSVQTTAVLFGRLARRRAAHGLSRRQRHGPLGAQGRRDPVPGDHVDRAGDHAAHARHADAGARGDAARRGQRALQRGGHDAGRRLRTARDPRAVPRRLARARPTSARRAVRWRSRPPRRRSRSAGPRSRSAGCGLLAAAYVSRYVPETGVRRARAVDEAAPELVDVARRPSPGRGRRRAAAPARTGAASSKPRQPEDRPPVRGVRGRLGDQPAR